VNNDIDALQRRFPWLQVQISTTEYLGPEYYERLLKPYCFGGRTDLEILCQWLAAEKTDGGNAPVLEIGPGPGRATSVFLHAVGPRDLYLVDLSEQMIAYCKRRFRDEQRLTFIRCDAIDFLRQSQQRFGLGFSLWSFSHSIHRAIQMLGRRAGEEMAAEAIRTLFVKVLEPGSRFLLIHFDPSSPEQRISLRQRAKLQPFLADGPDVPSRTVLDRVTQELVAQNRVRVCVEHLVGDPIRYENMNEALEIFMNLHMEGMFNNHPLLPEVMAELAADLAVYRDDDGAITIGTGCYLYLYETLTGGGSQ